MPLGDVYIYNLIHCTDSSKDRVNQATAVTPSPYSGLVVYIDGLPQADVYTVVPVGLNAAVFYSWMPPISASNLTSCADTNADKMYRVTNCSDPKSERYVLLPVAQVVGSTVLRFTGECTCWRVVELVSTYTEILTIAATFVSCADCQGSVTAELCLHEERTKGYAVGVTLPKPEPPDRGFKECCYSQLVFGDLSNADPYRNDFTSVYFQKQTPTDTVAFEAVGVNTGTTPLVDGIHGTLYDFSATNTNPNLSYFRVEWRKILDVIGADIFTIRMNITIAGVTIVGGISTNTFELKSFTVSRANNTVRIDSKMDGTLEKVNVNFKDSGYENSLRVQGYFGDAQDSIEQDNVVYSSKKGIKLFESQITMDNNPDYLFQANNIPECISRELRKFIIFGNEVFISDYNTNNHSYEYELLPVILDDISPYSYPIEGRGVNIEMTFKDRGRNNRKTNC